MRKQDTEKIKQNLKKYIDGLTVKKQKSSGKKYFFDKDDYLVLDIAINSKLVYTHKALFRMLKNVPDPEAKNMIKEALNDLGIEASSVVLMNKSYPLERSMFHSLPEPERKLAFEIYKAYHKRDKLIPLKKRDK